MPLDFLGLFLEENPDILYAAMRPQTGGYNFMDYWRRQQGNVWGDYLGSLGRTALAGQEPNQSFTSYLTGYPWLQQWMGLGPEQRGERQQRFAPQLRWNL